MVRYWVVRMNMVSLDSTSFDWGIGRKNNFVGIGWSRIGNLISCTKEELRDKLEKAYNPETPGTLNNWVSHCNSFINRIKEKDIVVLPENNYSGYDKISVGKVRSPEAYYVENPPDKARATLRRNVDWRNETDKEKLSPRLKKSLESPHTVYNIDKHEREIQALLKGKS